MSRQGLDPAAAVRRSGLRLALRLVVKVNADAGLAQPAKVKVLAIAGAVKAWAIVGDPGELRKPEEEVRQQPLCLTMPRPLHAVIVN